MRMRNLGQDDRVAWLLVPLLGLMISAGHAQRHRLRPDARREVGRRHNPGQPGRDTAWGPVLGGHLCAHGGRRGADGHHRLQRAEGFFEWQIGKAG
jgi:hypothetical protein